jgi:hypothetical protein
MAFQPIIARSDIYADNANKVKAPGYATLI